MVKRYFVIVDGRVQGVGFRTFASMHANSYKLTGSVRNMDNGMVELYVQGEETSINLFLNQIKKGNQFIRVDDMSLKEVAVVEGEKKFTYHW